MELCGGTHTTATGDIGMFKIVGESSVAAGVRRLEAVTGLGSYERLESDEQILNSLSAQTGSPRAELGAWITRLTEKQRQLEQELAALRREGAHTQLDALVGAKQTVGPVEVVSQQVEGIDGALLRELAENVRDRLGSGVVVLGLAAGQKATLVTTVSPDLQDRVHAGKLVKEIAALVGGSGGGRPDFAQAGGKDPEKLAHALQQVYQIVQRLVA
jgi:alanyl-tRNA synthetase